MAVGKLNVSPVTIRGIRSGFTDARFFVGCFVHPGEKHRTHSLEGPEPRWSNQLTCNVSEGDQFLYFELVNENPNNGGIVASGKTALKNVFNEGSETKWAPLQTPSGESFAEIQLNLSFDGSNTVSSVTSSFGDMNVSGQNVSYQTTTTQSYTTSHGHSDSRQSSFASLGPANPIPQNYGAGSPPPFTPPAGGSASSYSPGNNTMPGANIIKTESQTISTENMSKEEFEEQKARGNIPSWAKYGGGALGAAAAVGLAAWGAHELKEYYDKKEEEKSKHSQDAKPFIPSGHLQQQPANQPYAIENHGQKKESFHQPQYSEHKDYSEHKEHKDHYKKEKKEKKEKKKSKKHGKKHGSGSDSSSSDSSSDSD